MAMRISSNAAASAMLPGFLPERRVAGKDSPFQNTFCLEKIDQLAEPAIDVVGAEMPTPPDLACQDGKALIDGPNRHRLECMRKIGRRQPLLASRQPAGATGGQATKQDRRAMTELQSSPTTASAHECSLAKPESVEVKDIVCVECIRISTCHLYPCHYLA